MGLSAKEITKTIDKIKEEYDHYIVRFGKTLEMKRRFENRLYQADRDRMDMTVFLGIEVGVIQELVRKEEERIRARENLPLKKKPQTQSYADRVLAKLQKKIENYPSLSIHPEASMDVEKLYGTLEWFNAQIWGELKKGLKKRLTPRQLTKLEMSLESLVSYQGQLPKEVLHYQRLLCSQDASLKQISLQQNSLIQNASFFWHRLLDLVRRVDSELGIPGVEGAFYKKSITFLSQTIADFRLKDLKPQEGR
jgi:hypothetical protein